MTMTLSIIAATLMGLSAGLFATFSYVVMPGLARTDDATFVQSMRAVNAAILNPVFAVVFAGPAAAVVAAVIPAGSAGARPWLVAALALYVVGAFVVTGVVNVPLNDQMAAGTVPADQLRAAFERRWVAWNHVRSVLTVAAFVCALVGVTQS